MPFDKYLQEDSAATPFDAGLDAAFSRAVEFQIPQFIYTGTPTLAPGGGAEVLPFSPTGSLTSTWFTNYGFGINKQQQPFDLDVFPSPSVHSLSAATATPITAPSALGLPVYSASGFDLLSILARVATRPSPRISLGPVDLTCSFVVVDVRRYDHSIVYCSPSFCRLTGYSENEVLGRNCRFLQAPPSVGVRRGDERVYTDGERVKSMRKMLAADKECQISVVNYKRDGSAFCNLVTVIPIGGGEAGEGDENDIVYHVGFQVDLGEQPNVILKRLKEGSYAGVGALPPIQQQMILAKDTTVSATPNPKKGVVIPPITMSKTFKKLLNDPKFIASFPISTSTTVPTPLPTSASPAYENNPLSLILLEYSPDFIHVVSLKGAFLYVAPSVRRVLGWEPEDLVGKSVADLAHPEDVVPLMRELKEGSAGMAIGDRLPGDTIFAGAEVTKGSGIGVGGAVIPAGARTVDMLFRARTKSGRYVWVESRGRLHVEPGKGRKAIVLSGRAKEMGKLSWGAIAKYGMTKPVYAPMENLTADNIVKAESKVKMVRREFWAMAGGSGSVSFLFVGSGVTDVLGWEAEELIGKRISALVVDVDGNADGEATRLLQRGSGVGEVKEVRCAMAKKDGGAAQVAVVVFSTSNGNQDTEKLRVSPAPFVVQIKLVDASTASTLLGSLSSESTSAGTTSTSALVHPLDANVFEELETSRGTSWQYELEKLRFANVRLEQEIGRLEAVVAQGAGGEVGGDGAVCVAESNKAEDPIAGDAQYHLCSPMDAPLGSSTGEFETSIQQLPQEDLYDLQYQSRLQYQEPQAQHSQQETAPCRYMYSVPQRQHLQSHLRLSQVPQQQQQSVYATTPLQAPVPQTMTLPPLLQYENHDGYNNNHHPYHEEDPDQERQQKRMRYMGPRPEAQLPSRMPVVPVMGYTQPSHAPLPQVVVPSSRPSVSMQEWAQQQQRYVPQLRGLKRAWTGHES